MSLSQTRRSFDVVTEGAEPSLDRLKIILELFKEMDDLERIATVRYLAAKFGILIGPMGS